jgi:hypothetical protein
MGGILDTLEGFGISSAGFVFAIAIGTFLGVAFAFPTLMGPIISWLVVLLPVWGPIILTVIFWNFWITYRRAQFIANQDTMLLEIKIPRDIEKSPRAMELVFAGLFIGIGETTFIDRWIDGSVRTWFSFELVSDGGRIHFYVWTRRRFREIIETQIYAQYPSVEIYEAEDYAQRIDYASGKYKAWGCDFRLVAKDPYPIKTYIDYELDKDPKEEYRIDPIAHLFEFLSTLKPGEYAWYQIIIQTNKEKRLKKGSWFAKEGKWRGEAADEIAAIREKATPKHVDDQGKTRPGYMSLTYMQENQIKAIERSIDKPGYDTGIRGVYVAEKDSYRGVSVGGLTGVFKQFSATHFNGLGATRWNMLFDYPWQDFKGVRKERMLRNFFEAYRRRSWFHPPYETPSFVMTTEELATIYHFPSRGVQAPGLDRIPARKSEAPPNLPIS